MKEKTIFKVHLKELIASITTIIFITCYIIYPVWLVPGTFFLSFLSLLVFILTSIALFGIIYKVIPQYEKQILRFSKSNLINIIKNKYNLIFGIIILGYIILLIPSLEAVFTTAGDEGWHVKKITFLAEIYSLLRMIPFLLVWILGVLGLLLISILILLFSHFTLSPIKKIYRDYQNIAILGTVFFFLLTFIGSFILVFYFYQFTNLDSFLNRQKLIRYGPLHPITSLFIFFLFPWNDFALKSHSLILIILSSFFIRQIFFDLSSDRSSTNQIISILSVVLFLSFPIVKTYATLVYLTAGVVFFLILTTFTLIRFLKTNNNIYLYLTFIMVGIGFLWKTVHLFCAVGVGISLIVYLLSQHPTFKKDILINYIWGGIISLIFIAPWLLLSNNPVFYTSQDISRFDPSFLLTEAILDYFARANIEMGVLGIWCYFALIIFFLWSIIKKRVENLPLFFIFAAWYLFFTMDVGWGHYVDRFMVPGLSLLVISLFLLLDRILEYLKTSYHQRLISSKKLTNYQIVQRFGLGVILIGILGIASLTANAFQEENPNEILILPIEELAAYIADNINSQNIIYLGFPDVTPIGFYLEKFHSQVTTISTSWVPIEDQNISNFLEFLDTINATYFIFPFRVNLKHYSPSFIESLLDTTSIPDYLLIKQIGKGEEAIYIWKVL